MDAVPQVSSLRCWLLGRWGMPQQALSNARTFSSALLCPFTARSPAILVARAFEIPFQHESASFFMLHPMWERCNRFSLLGLTVGSLD
jgi:hypothetical protein